MKYKEKIKAIKLRKRGLSYKAILKKVSVSKSTLSIWLREIELTKEQKNKLLNRAEMAMYRAAKRKVANRIEKTNIIIEKAKKEVGGYKANSLFLIGISLYWAEGAKSQDETVKFSNSDEKMISLAMQWFREICGVPEKKFRVHVHMHNLHCRKDILRYWSKITNIPSSQFYKPYVKKTSLGQRKNILYNGTCSIVVNDKDLFRKIMGWKVGLEEEFIYPL
jgi:transcriptional regulator with XRE-family HTH domain